MGIVEAEDWGASGRSGRRVLLVEPESATRELLSQAAGKEALVDGEDQFSTARTRLSDESFDFLVTNMRLKEFNGLHLVHLASTKNRSTRCIVYDDRLDIALAEEARRAGAFYETSECLRVTLAAYLRGQLPEQDRRDHVSGDRRRSFRGGRRCWDEHVASQER
jgi:DNA-binding NtrC family response regulator